MLSFWRNVGWELFRIHPNKQLVTTTGKLDFKGAVFVNLCEATLTSRIEGVYLHIGSHVRPVAATIRFENSTGDFVVGIQRGDLEVHGYGLGCGILSELYLFGEAIIDPGCFRTWCRAYVDLPDARTCIEFVGTGRASGGLYETTFGESNDLSS